MLALHLLDLIYHLSKLLETPFLRWSSRASILSFGAYLLVASNDEENESCHIIGDSQGTARRPVSPLHADRQKILGWRPCEHVM